MTSPVSVIIPTFNRAEMLRDAIESVYCQTYGDWELIVVDDGSTDSTRKMVRAYEPRIKYVYQGNKGLSSARNLGISLSGGELIAFLDADDIWLPDKLELQVRMMRRSQDIGLVGCGAYLMNAAGQTIGEIRSKNYSSRHELLRDLYIRNVIVGSASGSLVRRACFGTAGLFDETLRSAEDWDMWLRIARSYEIRFIEKPLVKIRDHSDGMHRDVERMKANQKRVIGKNLVDVGRWHRGRAYSYIYLDAAREYYTASRKFSALVHTLKAIWTYPFKVYPEDDRYQLLIKCLLPDFCCRLSKKIWGRLADQYKREPAGSRGMSTLGQQVGWKFLLDLTHRGSALNVDTSHGLSSISLAGHFDKVYAVTFDQHRSEEIRRAIKSHGAKNVFVITLAHPSSLPFLSRCFDAVILHHLDEALPPNVMRDQDQARTALCQLIREASRVLSSSGQLYVSAKNRWGYDHLFKRPNDRGYVLPKTIEKIMKQAGFRSQKTYFLYPGIDHISEIMGFSDAPVQDAVTRQESFKLGLLRNRFFRWLSPAFGIVAYKGTPGPSFIERIVEEVNRHPDVPDEVKHCSKIKRYLILECKVVLLIGRPQSSPSEVAVHLPLSPLAKIAVAQLRNQAAILSDLKHSGARIQDYVPTFYFEGELAGRPYFVMEAMRGISVDLPIHPLRRVIEEAADLLIQFHQDTLTLSFIDAEIFQRFFLDPLNTLSEALGHPSAGVREIEHYLRETLIGQTIPLVWEHGDFYHENLLMDPTTFRITGVIDWEMSRRQGLPLLDLLCLFTRSEILFEQKDLSSVFRDKILSRQFSDAEEGMLDRYLETIPVSRQLILPLAVMFWIHCVRSSEGFRSDRECLDRNVDALLSVIRPPTPTPQQAMAYV